MIGILVATHGKMSDGLVEAADLIIGSTENVKTFNLFHGDDIQVLGEQMAEAIQEVDQGEGVLIFTDIFGASPYNQALLAVNSLAPELQERTFVLTGVNLPMLLVALNHRMMGTPVAETAASVLSEAQQSLVLWPTQETAVVLTDDDDDF